MKKLMVMILVFALSLSGCAAVKSILRKPCDNPEKVEEYKSRIKSSLALVQMGYPIVCNILKINPSTEVQLNVASIDKALDVLGELYYDRICPTVADVETAETYADVAQSAKANIGAL